MRITARLYLPTVEEMIKNCGLNKGGRIQQHIDQFVLEKSEPYIPKGDSGGLILSGSNATRIGSGQVIWDAPHAHYQHEGLLMVSPTTGSSWAKKHEQKIYAEPQKTLDYHSGDENRKDHWVDRMLVDEKEKLIEECQKIANGEM